MKNIINDKLIQPFEIHVDSENFVVGIPHVTKEGKAVLTGSKFYTSLPRALEYIVKSNMANEGGEFTIKEYITEFINRLQNIKQTIKLY